MVLESCERKIRNHIRDSVIDWIIYIDEPLSRKICWKRRARGKEIQFIPPPVLFGGGGNC
jgi:hypothetical protein